MDKSKKPIENISLLAMRASLLIITIFLSLEAWAGLQHFEIRDLTQRNLMAFVSDAPLEKMIAQCHLLRGWVEVNPQQISEGIKGEIELDTRSCETGSGIRDLLLQEKILDIKQYPLAKIQIVKWVKELSGTLTEKADEKRSVELAIDYRGKITTMEAPIKLSYFLEGEKTKNRLPGNLLKISSQVELGLSSLGITIPEDLKQTLSSKLEVIFDSVGTSKLPNDKVLLPEGAKPKERE